MVKRESASSQLEHTVIQTVIESHLARCCAVEGGAAQRERLGARRACSAPQWPIWQWFSEVRARKLLTLAAMLQKHFGNSFSTLKTNVVFVAEIRLGTGDVATTNEFLDFCTNHEPSRR